MAPLPSRPRLERSRSGLPARERIEKSFGEQRLGTFALEAPQWWTASVLVKLFLVAEQATFHWERSQKSGPVLKVWLVFAVPHLVFSVIR